MDGKMRETVKLISMEGFEFVIDREAAMVSHTIRSMLTSPGGFSESKDGVVTFPDISTPILEKICQYFYWSLQYSRFHPLTRVEECTNRKIVSLQTLYPVAYRFLSQESFNLYKSLCDRSLRESNIVHHPALALLVHLFAPMH